MILEVTGTGTLNKGAELLLVAIKAALACNSEIQLAVSPRFGPYHARAGYGLLQKVKIDRLGRSKVGFSILPASFRAAYGMVTENDIDGIIDASGFAFGDQLPVSTAQHFAADCIRWKKQGKPIVLLPQAFGPFKKKEARLAFQLIAQNADLIFARDKDSLQFAKIAAPEEEQKIRLAPDITINVDGPALKQKDVSDQTALIVPNVRMLDRTNPQESQAYLPFLARCVKYVREKKLDPVLLLHSDRDDDRLVNAVHDQINSKIPVIRETDPIKLKGILQSPRLVIASRFHALVAALSGGVPAIAVGWSHKYKHLLNDFQCPDMFTSVNAPPDEMLRLITQVQTEHAIRSERLRIVKMNLSTKIDTVWKEAGKIFSF